MSEVEDTLEAPVGKVHYTPEERARIVDAHIQEHGGVLRIEEFLAAAQSSNHPAHGFFEWDDTAAGHRYRMSQARAFVSVRVVRREVKTVTVGSEEIRLAAERHAVRDPLRERDPATGYVLRDTESGKAAADRRAVFAFKSWFRHYHESIPESEQEWAGSILESMMARCPEVFE